MKKIILKPKRNSGFPVTALFVILTTIAIVGCTKDEWDFGKRVPPVTPITVTYVNVDEVNPLNATLYTMEGKPFFTHVVFSTATVTTDASQKAILSYSDKVGKALELTPQFHEKGVKVILSITGSRCGLGFANMDKGQIADFVSQVKAVVNDNDLDGVDFNDDNANYGMYGFSPANSASYAEVISAMREALGEDKLITVYDNLEGYSRHLTSVASLVDYAWSSKYGLSIDSRSRIGLANWQYCGFSQKLNLEFASTDTYTVQQQLRQFQESNMGALMFYDLRKTPQFFSIPGQYDWQEPTEYTVTTEDVRQILDRTAERIFQSTVEAPDDSELLDW